MWLQEGVLVKQQQTPFVVVKVGRDTAGRLHAVVANKKKELKLAQTNTLAPITKKKVTSLLQTPQPQWFSIEELRVLGEQWQSPQPQDRPAKTPKKKELTKVATPLAANTVKTPKASKGKATHPVKSSPTPLRATRSKTKKEESSSCTNSYESDSDSSPPLKDDKKACHQAKKRKIQHDTVDQNDQFEKIGTALNKLVELQELAAANLEARLKLQEEEIKRQEEQRKLLHGEVVSRLAAIEEAQKELWAAQPKAIPYHEVPQRLYQRQLGWNAPPQGGVLMPRFYCAKPGCDSILEGTERFCPVCSARTNFFPGGGWGHSPFK